MTDVARPARAVGATLRAGQAPPADPASGRAVATLAGSRSRTGTGLPCNLRDVALFVAAYEERSFTAAAQREHATQSGVSQHMRNLEHQLGVQLFLREHDGVVPTPAADTFYQSCLEILRAHAAARSAVGRFASGPCGALRVGLIPTITARLLAPALGAFLSEAPNVAVRVQEGYSAALTQMVRSGELDFAIVPAFGGTAGVRRHRFLRTRETLVMRAGRGCEPGTPLRLADLGPLRLVLPGAANTRRRTIETYCADQGVPIAQSVELDAMLGALDFVARSDWVAILPEVMLDGAAARHGLTAHPIVSPDLHLDLMLIEPSRRPISAPAARFVALLRDAALHGGALRAAEGPVRLVAHGG